MILVLSTPRDEHAAEVLAELARRDAPATLLDLSEFPQRMGLTLRFRDGGHGFAFGCAGKAGLDLDDCGAVWWRRPQSPEVSPEVGRASHRHFALSESAEALTGLWHALDAYWMNDPACDQVASRKVYQLRVAQQVGLAIPETVITNCPASARELVARRGSGGVVYKAFSATEAEWRETRLLREQELDLLESVRFAPVIFQEYVEAEVDLRITAVGDALYPAAIHSQESRYKVDFRMDMGAARVEPATLPAEVTDGLRALMRRLGLVYGAIDMRRTPDGRYVFLEVNPSGQWLFVESRTGQPITAAVAGLLQANDR
jgi:glutathione synthase/RimK-type ligase-like ATP-grasp enzyme